MSTSIQPLAGRGTAPVIHRAAPAARSLPGDFAMWVFILAELLVFGVFFLSYAFSRSQNVALFNASQEHLSRMSGAFNTLVLITGSYFVVRAVQAIKAGRQDACVRGLAAALVCGSVFVINKLLEFTHAINAGISLSTNTFYMFYLSMTFFHFLHVILGMVILGAVLNKARNGGYSRHDHTGVETGAVYWHMVDLVWIVLFPLVYVMH